MTFLSTLLLSVFITIALIPVCMRLAGRLKAMDLPDARKVHLTPIPRCGGLAMAAGIFLPFLYWRPGGDLVSAFLIGAGIIVFFGIADDFFGLGYRAKFIGQIAAALVAVLYGGIEIRTLGMLLPADFLLPGWAAFPLTVLAIVGVTNAINLADGLDGLAGGISLLSFCCIGYLAWLHDATTIALLATALAGAIFGFLRFNTHPASVFMGDTGSQLLGFSAIVLSLGLTQGQTAVSPLVPLILLGFPVLDTLSVMAVRISEGRSPFSPDKNHFHHNLMALGLYHPESVLVIYVIQSVLMLWAFFFRYYSELFLLLSYIVFSASILFLFAYARRTGWQWKRTDLIDQAIKGRLRQLRDDGTLIKATFRIFQYGIPLLLLVACIVPREVPQYVSAGAAGLLALFALSWIRQKKVNGALLWMTIYLLIPFAVYLGDTAAVSWMNGWSLRLYNLAFALFAVFIIVVAKFSRRQAGFKSTPLDFLILVIAVVVPNLPDPVLREYQMGLVAAKVIMLYFSFEVLMGELRGDFRFVSVVAAISLGVMGIKGLI
jgi:UDP-GlcNAc:undecaprenyl-phosphate GlcNAc-1-phosphate transferase